jgi:hypothetical protein
MSYILCVYLLTFFFILKHFQPLDTTGALGYWPFWSSRFLCCVTVYHFLWLQMSSATLCISHLQHAFCFSSTYVFSLQLLKLFLTSFSTVEHLFTLVHLGQFAVPFVRVVRSVATVRPWAVMCAGGTTLTHHFIDTVRDRRQGCVAAGCILFCLGIMRVLPFCISVIP